MGEKKEKKEMSKGMRIFVIVLLSILCIYLLLGLIFTAKDGISKGGTPVLLSICLILVLDIFCAYGVIKNISKLKGKDNQELTTEQLQKRKKLKNAFIIIPVIIVGIVGGISLSNVFDGTYNTNTQKQTLDQYAGSWVHYSPYSTGIAMTLTIDGKGNFTEKMTSVDYNRTLVYNGTYKIENDIITLYEDGNVHSQWKIVNSNLLRNADSKTLTEYRKVK